MIQMKEANGSTPLTYFRTFVSVHSRFNGCQFLFCEVIISGFWHALSLSRLLRYFQRFT